MRRQGVTRRPEHRWESNDDILLGARYVMACHHCGIQPCICWPTEFLSESERAPSIPHLPVKLKPSISEADARIAELEQQLELAVAVAEAARWACVAVLDRDTPLEEMTMIRPLAAEQLLKALKAYDEDREKRGLVSVAKRR
jgi:hypothetical protein